MDRHDDPLPLFAATVRRLRKRRKLTQMQLADLCDLNLSDISRIEKLTREPGLRVVVKVARGLGVRVGELFEGVDTVGTREAGG